MCLRHECSAVSRFFSERQLPERRAKIDGCEPLRLCELIQEFLSVRHGIAAAYFQRAIEAALGGLRFTCCVVYIDDVVVHSKGSFEDHVAKVQAALRALRVVGFPGLTDDSLKTLLH